MSRMYIASYAAANYTASNGAGRTSVAGGTGTVSTYDRVMGTVAVIVAVVFVTAMAAHYPGAPAWIVTVWAVMVTVMKWAAIVGGAIAAVMVAGGIVIMVADEWADARDRSR